MKSKFALTKRGRLLLGAVIICAVLIAGLVTLWPSSKVAEAAIINPHPGLVGWWRFDEGSGSIATDSSQYGNDGTVYGATWVDGKYGKALSFNGVDNYVNVAHSDSVNVGLGSYTVTFWMKTTDFSVLRNILDKRRNAGIWPFFFQLQPSGKILFDMQTTSGWAPVFSSNSISSDTWAFIVGVRDNAMGKLRIYVNNVVAEANHASGDASNTQPFEVARGYASGNLFNGVIDEVRIYNRALSATEIQEIFQKSPDFSSRLLATVPKGTTQFIATVSWQGIGSINVTIQSPSKNYTEDIVPVYQKTTYSASSGPSNILNIKRLTVSIAALTSDQNWYIILNSSNVQDYKMTAEVQK